MATFLPHQHCVGTPPIALCREEDEAELLIIDGFVSLSLCSSLLSLSLSVPRHRRRVSMFSSSSSLSVPVVVVSLLVPVVVCVFFVVCSSCSNNKVEP